MLRSSPGRPICKASRSIAEFTLASACYGSMPLKAAEVTPSMLVGVAVPGELTIQMGVAI